MPQKSRRAWLLIASSMLLIGVVTLTVFIMHARPASHHEYFSLPLPARPLVIAHRGGAGLRPENTLEAFNHAARIGADVLEMDVRRARDGALVIIHDASVERTTNGTGGVASLTLAELKKLDAGYKWTRSGDEHFTYRGQGLTIPTVEEVFRAFPDKHLLIEIKQGEQLAVAMDLCDLIRTHKRERTTLVASVSHDMITEFRRRCSAVATSASADEARNFLTLDYTNLTAAYTPHFNALQVPPSLGALPVVTRSFVQAAHARNIAVHPWTINDASQMESLLAIGVDGIITDRPDLLLDVLRARGGG